MSLQVWLPLTKDARNQGLANPTITTSSVTWNTDGKLGTKSFSGNASITNTINSNDFSVSWWQKSSSTSTYDFKIPINNTGTTTTLNFYRMDYTSSVAIKICTPNNAPQMIWIYDSRNNGANDWILDQWNHFCITVSGATSSTLQCTAYVNGKQYGQYNSSSYWFKLISGNITFSGTSSFNDIRIYDHCLSPMEVKKISQGLILHYNLSSNFIENTINYLDIKSNHFTNYWGSYGFGSKGTITTASGQAPKYNGEVAQLTNKTTETSNSTVEMATTFSAVYSTVMQKGESFTVTAWVKGNDATIGKTCFAHIYNTNGTDTISTSGTSVTLTNKWQKISHTMTWTYDTASTNSGHCYVCVSMKGGESIFICNVQVEKKNHATAFTESSRNTVNIYDSSGFGNHGIIHGTLITSNDIPKYKASTYAVGSATTYVEGPILPAEAKTVALWIKADKSVNGAIFNDKTSTLQIGLLNSLLYMNSAGSTAGFTTSHWVNGEWNHVVAINNNGTRSLYVNGQAEVQNGAANYYIHNADNCWLWNRSYNNNYPFTGNLSDLRVYATALSAADVLALYNNKNF